MKKQLLSFTKSLAIVSAFALVFTSCTKDEVVPETAYVVKNAVFVSHEGGYNKQQATVAVIDLDNSQVTEDVYAANNGGPLGDIAQSITEINGKVYVVVNNSHKVVAINSTSYKKEGEITGLGSPNFIVAGSNGQAYISDLFGGPISVVDLASNAVVKSIPCPGMTYEMLTVGSKTYVTNSSSDYLYVINHTTNAISDSIQVGEGAQTIQLDANGKIWVGFGELYDSNYQVIENGKIKQINPSNKEITFSKTLTEGGVKRIRMNKEKTSFFFLNGGIFKMAVTDSELPASAFYGSGYFNGLGVDHATGLIYACDAKDYVSKGSVVAINANGTLAKTYTVNIAPGDFYFVHR